MLNGTKPLLSAGDLLSFAEYICNALFVVSVVAFRFLAHDPVKILILVLAWWYGQFTWRENHHIQWITLKDSFFFNCTKLFALILIQCQSCWNVSDITKQLQPLINGFFLSCEYDWLTSTADATFLLIFIFIAVINAQLIFLVIAVCCIFCIIHDLDLNSSSLRIAFSTTSSSLSGVFSTTSSSQTFGEVSKFYIWNRYIFDYLTYLIQIINSRIKKPLTTTLY